MLIIKKLIFIALLILPAYFIHAQNTNSPYSRYGYGILKDNAIGPSKGMGGISYGLRGQFTNPGNPASYSGVDSLSFIFDIGASYYKERFSDQNSSVNRDNGGIEYMSILFPIGNKIGVSAGFLPYSSVGYNFGATNKISGSTATYTEYFTGSGGLTQIYGGIAYAPFKWISVGANVSYLYGKIRHDRSLSFSDQTAYTSNKYVRLNVSGVKFDIGIQYQIPLADNKRTLTIGATYTPKINPNARIRGLEVVGSERTDSLYMATDISFPHTIGLGFTFSNNSTLIFGADATYQKWSDLAYPTEMDDNLETADRFNDRWRFNAGVEYVIDPSSRSFLKKIRFRGGVKYSNSYLNTKNRVDNRVGGYDEIGATLGFGLPFKSNIYSDSRHTSYINITFQYNKLSPEFSSMVKEQYFGVTLGVNISELWFLKNKFR